MDTHNKSVGAAPEWSAFREASFGVADLTILNDTHMSFTWLRHACESDSDESLHMNFSDSCVTPGDDSPMNMLTSDSIMIIRPDYATCSNRHASTAQGDDDIFTEYWDGGGDDSSDDKSLSTLEMILIAIVATLVVSNLFALLLVFKSRQRSEGLREYRHDNHEVVSPVSNTADAEMKNSSFTNTQQV